MLHKLEFYVQRKIALCFNVIAISKDTSERATHVNHNLGSLQKVTYP